MTIINGSQCPAHLKAAIIAALQDDYGLNYLAYNLFILVLTDMGEQKFAVKIQLGARVTDERVYLPKEWTP